MKVASVPDDPYQAVGVVAALAAPLLMIGLVALYDHFRGNGKIASQFQEMVDEWFAPVKKRDSLTSKVVVALGLLIAAPVLLVMLYVIAVMVLMTEAVLIGGVLYGVAWVVSLPFPDYTMPLAVVVVTGALVYVAALAVSILFMADA